MMNHRESISYCNKCVYPAVSVNLILDDDGVCSACRMQEQFDSIPSELWQKREMKFRGLVENAKKRSMSNYDCIVPVSGGKDSYFQVHKVLEYGLKPLLVTYHGNNYLPEGQRNLDRMRERLNVDCLVFGPSIGTLIKLNRGCFELMGDMNWHAHAGIKTYPMKVAVNFKIPLVIWGEVTWSVSGMYDPDDYVQYNKRTVFEHDMRGYSPKDIEHKIPTISSKDLAWLQMPSDSEIEQSGTVGIYIGNFFKWDPNVHALEMKQKYDFEFAEKPFDRTYRMMSNLDDMHENGAHDYLKFIKFGYGRATDHASKDVRSGYMSREKAIEIVLKMDHVRSRDIKRWCEYVGISEDQFDFIADTFRDPRVWWIDNGLWYKQNINGVPSSYGEVRLDKNLWERYIR